MWREGSHTREIRCRGIGWLGISNFPQHGVPLDASGAYAFRMFGGAIFAIGIACWLSREDSTSAAARGLIIATAFYDFVFVAILVASRFVGGLSGIALWPTVVLHLGLAVSCLFCLRQGSVVRVG
jgi:hypothetical protein